MNFDTEHFITEIQKRPAIWHTKSLEYSDKNLRQNAWKELIEVYGAKLPQIKKKQLGLDLQKRWRNIRDSFVKTYKAKKSRSGYAAKKKISYIFYDNLLFLKDTININRTDYNSSNDVNTATKNDDNQHDVQLVEGLAENFESTSSKKIPEDDEDRLFFLSLIKDFKRVPEHMQTQTKLDILKVIMDAQQFCDYSNTPWSFLKTNHDYQTASYSRNDSYTEPAYESQVGPSLSQNLEGQSPASAYSQESHDSKNSSYIEFFDSNNDNS